MIPTSQDFFNGPPQSQYLWMTEDSNQKQMPPDSLSDLHQKRAKLTQPAYTVLADV